MTSRIALALLAISASCLTASAETSVEDTASKVYEFGELSDFITNQIESFDGDISTANLDEEVGMDVPEIIAYRGYDVETYTVTTDDGYILTMFRIPRGRNEITSQNSTTIKPVVILQHGLLDSSFTWVSNFAHQSLAYVLADAGYDVFLSNSRGTRYGKEHTTLDMSEDCRIIGNCDPRRFFEFSYDHMAAFDLPAFVDKALEISGMPTLSWIGHSQGTIQAFAAFSKPTQGIFSGRSDIMKALDHKVNLLVALAPVSYVYNQKSRLLDILAGLRLPELIGILPGPSTGEFLSGDRLNDIAPGLCSEGRINGTTCANFISFLTGPFGALNETRMPVYISATPAGTSVYNMEHWAQGVRRNNFQMFDQCFAFVPGSNCVQNSIAYGQRSPPDFDLGNIDIPVALFSGTNDYLASPKDVQKIRDEVKENQIVHDSVTENYGHLDFTWGIDVASGGAMKIYGEVADILRLHKCPGGDISICLGKCPISPPEAYTDCIDVCSALC